MCSIYIYDLYIKLAICGVVCFWSPYHSYGKIPDKYKMYIWKICNLSKYEKKLEFVIAKCIQFLSNYIYGSVQRQKSSVQRHYCT